MKVLVVGKGEVGSAIGQLISSNYDVDYLDPKLNLFPTDVQYDVAHICFGCTEVNSFVDQVYEMFNLYHPKIIIVNATIPLEIHIDLPCFLYHWPVRGTHPDIYAGLLKYLNFIGAFNETKESYQTIQKYLHKIQMKTGFRWAHVNSHKESALGKLINTSWYAMQIAFCNQIKLLCDQEGIDFDQAYTRFMETDEIGLSYVLTDLEDNRGKRSMAKELIPRPVMRPGSMGGHCLAPNLKLLKDHAFEMVDWIQRMDQTFRRKRS